MSDDVKLLVRVDDAGASWSSNMGCLKACTTGIARSVEVMMPGAWVTHAAQLFNPLPQIDIGIHLTLTSEWDAVRWRPLTPAVSLTGPHGQFPQSIMPGNQNRRPSLSDMAWSLEDVACEFRAQIEMGLALFRNVSHVSAHMVRDFKDVDPALGDLVHALCEEYGLREDAFGQGLPRFQGYDAHPRDAATRAASFANRLAALRPGTHIFIDHPAVASPELEQMGHDGYRDVADDRIGCLDVLTDPKVGKQIEQLGIKLISYRDL